MMFRSGQLYRSSNISRKPPAKPAPQALRLLAPRRRLDRHPPARLLRHHLHRILCRNFSGARVPRLRRELEQRRDLSGLDPLGALAHRDRGPRRGAERDDHGGGTVGQSEAAYARGEYTASDAVEDRVRAGDCVFLGC